MNLQKCILTNNDCYKTAKPMKIRGIMVHSTGVNNPYLKRYVQPNDGKLGKNQNGNHWNQPKPDGRSVCVHAFIGRLENGEIATYQTLPFTMQAWHCGGSGNNGYISFEICEDNLQDKIYFKQVYQEAVEFCVYLCKQFHLTAQDIICHAEGYKLGIASNHSDVLHWFSKHNVTMDDFRKDVQNGLESKNSDEMAGEIKMIYNYVDENMPDWAKPVVQKLIKKGALKGNEKGELMLTYEMLRMFEINDRMGLYGK